MSKYKNIKISIIGAGKLASSLMPALLDKNYKINSIFDIHKESAAELAIKYNIKKYADALFDIDRETNLFFLTVPDGELKKVAGILSLLDLDYTECLFVHCSGSRNVRVLEALREKGANVASFHPMQTFPSRKKVSLKNNYVAIESDNSAIAEYLEEIANDLELLPIRLKPEEKVYYHLLGVFASNFLSANMFEAESCNELIESAIPDIYKLLKPIVNSTYTNISKNGAVESLSGPIERGEFETVEMHVNALHNNNELKLHYLANSLTLLEAAHSKGTLSEREYGRLKLYLTTELKDLTLRL
jgi:predicted short-subunit dehydrogenase-like oxidoreductase (DUF2520 family)